MKSSYSLIMTSYWFFLDIKTHTIFAQTLILILQRTERAKFETQIAFSEF
jgi:hypothetical protein